VPRCEWRGSVLAAARPPAAEPARWEAPLRWLAGPPGECPPSQPLVALWRLFEFTIAASRRMHGFSRPQLPRLASTRVYRAARTRRCGEREGRVCSEAHNYSVKGLALGVGSLGDGR
jgi:hypothetical protein